MKAARSGHIVNIASTAAKRAWANATACHATKWGLLGFSHALHVEARPSGVKVSAVIAGGTKTPLPFDRIPDLDPDPHREPAGATGDIRQEPADVAAAVRFLLTTPAGTVIPEIMVLPMRETSWP